MSLIGALAVADAGTAAAEVASTLPVPQRAFVLDEAPRATFACQGRLRDFTRAISTNWLLVVPERNPGILQMFANRDERPYRDLLPWSGEFAGKHLTGATDILRLTADKTLHDSLQSFVHHLIALQDADGYLGPFPKDARLVADAPNCKGTWDAWGHYHAMLGLLDWYDLTHDADALHAATRIGDLLCDHFLGHARHVLDMGQPDQNQAVVHGLCLLYERTGTKRYLDLARQVVDEFEAPGAGDYVRTALAGTEFFATPKPRWESLHAIEALPLLYRITGDDKYAKAFQHIWWSIDKLDRHNNGGFSSGEQAVGNPYSPAPIETCCTIAWIAMSVDMLCLTGDPIIADELELSTLNQAFALESPDGSWCTYNTPMDGKRVPSSISIAFQKRAGTEDLSCCSVNAARGFGMVSHWALLASSGGLCLNWYGPSVISADVGATRVTLTQTTDYPRTGHIDLKVDPGAPVDFELSLRIPNWSTHTRLRVNDEPAVDTRQGSYARLKRAWKAGDRVSLDLDLSLHAWIGERDCTGKASLYRGPILLAYAVPPAPAPIFGDGWKDFGTLWASQTPGSFVEQRFEGDTIAWKGRKFDDAGMTRVQIDGNEIGVIDQYGPKRDQPFTWSHAGLGAGPHSLRLTVTGEKNAASSGTWSNVSAFADGAHGSSPATPALDLSHLRATLRPAESGSELEVDVQSPGAPLLGLLDYASAGNDGRQYFSWLPCRKSASVPFTHDNPLRLMTVQRDPQ